MGQAARAKENPVSQGPEATGKEPKPWDRKCTVCGTKCNMVTAEVFDEENFECANEKCRASYLVKTFYGKGGVFIMEQFMGMTEGPING